MSASARLRATAAKVVAAVIDGESLQTALPGASASSGNAAQLQAVCYGTLRAFIRLDALLTTLLDKPLKARDSQLRALMLVGLFELGEGHTPAHAVVAETVNASQRLRMGHARGLVNAVLRRYLRERDSLEAKIDKQPHVRSAQPPWLHNALLNDWPDDWQSIAAASNAHPPMWLRVNRRAGSVADYEQELLRAGVHGAHRHAFATDALRLAQPLPVTAVPGFDAGKVSVQDAGAQLAARLLAAAPGEKILDACAAPGGKTTHIAELANCECEILAVDVNAERLQRVHDNVKRLRLDNITTCAGDANAPDTWWDGEPFDRILLDVPCSATGVIRRHPDIRLLRREADIESLAKVQLQMLTAIWPLLKPGGRLLYSTCSVLRAENEQVVADFKKKTSGAISLSLPEAMPGRSAGDGRQILPGETDMDGFYYAWLVKKGLD